MFLGSLGLLTSQFVLRELYNLNKIQINFTSNYCQTGLFYNAASNRKKNPNISWKWKLKNSKSLVHWFCLFFNYFQRGRILTNSSSLTIFFVSELLEIDKTNKHTHLGGSAHWFEHLRCCDSVIFTKTCQIYSASWCLTDFPALSKALT